MSLTIKTIEDREVWQGFLKKSEFDYFLQSWQWGEFQSLGLGKKIFRLGFYDRGLLVGVCLAITEKTRFGEFIYIPRGPVFDWENLNLVDQIIFCLVNFFRNQHYFQLRIEPLILADNLKIAEKFTNARFVKAIKSIQVERAWILELQNSTEEELLKNMRKNTRYYIKRGQKSGLTVDFSTSIESLHEFLDLLEQTSARKKFLVASRDYLEKEFVFLKNNILQVATAKFAGKAVAAALIAFYGKEASYLHAATAEDTLKLEPSYYLQWECIRYAKSLGLSQYNFWGVVSEQNYHKNHPGYGYSNFKRGFGGELKTYLKPQDFVYKKIPYYLFKLQEWYRQKRDKVI